MMSCGKWAPLKLTAIVSLPCSCHHESWGEIIPQITSNENLRQNPRKYAGTSRPARAPRPGRRACLKAWPCWFSAWGRMRSASVRVDCNEVSDEVANDEKVAVERRWRCCGMVDRAECRVGVDASVERREAGRRAG